MSLRSPAVVALLVVFGLAIGPVASAHAGSADAAAPSADAAAVGDATAPSADAAGVVDATAAAPHNGTLETPKQTLRITLRTNGNARWEVTLAFSLSGADERAAFEDLGTRFENGETDLLALSYYQRAAAGAAAQTGRSMTIRQPDRSYAIENDTGLLTLSFTWTSFARVGDNTLAVGDAFNTTNGTWLPYLTRNQALEIAPPPGYRVDSAPPVQLTNSVARWEGYVDFSGRTPWIIYAGDGSTTTTATPTPTPTTTASPTTTTPPGPSSSSLPLVLLLVVVGGGLVLVAVYASRYGTDGLPGLPGEGGSGDSGDGAGADAETAAASAGDTGESASTETAAEPESTTGAGESGAPAAADSAGATAGAAASDAEAAAEAESESESEEAAEEDEIDLELLSDEERVEHLLEQNGGRMKQANIVKETGWSNAKVSQLLSSMDEDDRIDKLRIGRENLISFPDEDITDFDSE